MSANLEFYSRFDAIDIPFALRTIAADRRSRAKGWGLKVRVRILAIALFCVAAVSVFFTAASPGVLVSVMLLIGASVAIIRHGKAVYQTSLQTSPLRGGVARIVLSPSGMRIMHPGYELWISWSHMEGLISTDKGLLLVIDMFDYCPIALSAFQDAAHMKEVAKQIERWRETSQHVPSDRQSLTS